MPPRKKAFSGVQHLYYYYAALLSVQFGTCYSGARTPVGVVVEEEEVSDTAGDDGAPGTSRRRFHRTTLPPPLQQQHQHGGGRMHHVKVKVGDVRVRKARHRRRRGGGGGGGGGDDSEYYSTFAGNINENANANANANANGNVLMEPTIEIRLPLHAAGFRGFNAREGEESGGAGGGAEGGDKCTGGEESGHSDCAASKYRKTNQNDSRTAANSSASNNRTGGAGNGNNNLVDRGGEGEGGEEGEGEDPWLLLTPLSQNEHFPEVVSVDAAGEVRAVLLDRSHFMRGVVVGPTPIMLPGTDDAGSWPSSTPSSTTTPSSSSSSSPSSSSSSANGSRNEGGGELSPAHRRYTRSSHEMLLYKASDADADINGGHGSNGSNDSKGDRSSERESGRESGSGSGGGSDDEGREAHGGAFCNGAHAPPPDTAADAEKSRQHLHHHQHQLHQQQDQQQNKAHNHTHNYQRREESLPLDTCMVTLVADSSFYVSNGENTAGAVALMMQYIEFADLKLRSTSINGGGYGVAIKKILITTD
eukprot:gene14264-27687_t